MKKNSLLTAIAFVIAITMVAFSSCCDHYYEIIVPPATEKVAVKFSSNIVTMGSNLRMAGNTWDAEDAIGVYMLEKESTTEVENTSNVEYITETGGQTSAFKAKDKIIYYPDNDSEVRFMSYYPYKESIIDAVYKVDISTQTNQSSIDFLYSFNIGKTYKKTTASSVIPLVFDHKLTKVLINVKPGTGLATSDIDDINVYFSGLNTTADFNLKNGTLSNPSNTKNITPLTVMPVSGYTFSSESIILPMATIPTGAKIVFELLNGSIFIWDFNMTLNAATKYTYNVTINRTGIEVEATINDWINGGDADVNAE